MKRIILCEGKTDAMFLGSILARRFGWQRVKRSILQLPVNEDHELMTWFQRVDRPDQDLAIWGVGGFDQLRTRFMEIIERTRSDLDDAGRFSLISLVFDHDQRTAVQLIDWITGCLRDGMLTPHSPITLGEWLDAETLLTNITTEQVYSIKLLPIVLPPAGEGSLETFLLNAIKILTQDDGQLVEESYSFTNRVPRPPFLGTMSDREKATLGSVLMVKYPDAMFLARHIRLTQFPWEEHPAVQEILTKFEFL